MKRSWVVRTGPHRLLLAGALAAGLPACEGRVVEGPTPASEVASAREGTSPNLLLISIDSLRADHLGCYGYDQPTSPAIDRLAADGVRFALAISTTSWTLPSHAAMLTGLNDSAHGVTDRTRRLADEQRTLAECLRDGGYRTAGFFGGPFLHPVFGLHQGFEVWEDCMADIPESATRSEVESAMDAEEAVMHGDVTGPRTLAAVEAWSDQPDPRPFFLFVHLWDVHYDYLAPKEYVDLFDPDYEGPIDGLDFENSAAVHRRMDKRDLRHLIAMYDAEIRFTDDIVAGILAALRGRGMLANTLVVLTADHGDEFFDHGGKGHQETLYDEVVHVPLIFHWPGKLASGRVVEQQVSLVSLMPTLLALAGISERPASSGRDLRPLLEGRSLAPAPAFSELLVHEPIYALRSEDLKVLYLPGNPARVYAFDLTSDPREKRRLETEANPRIAEAVTAIQARIAAGGEAAASAVLELELERRLDSLGYLGETPDDTER